MRCETRVRQDDRNCVICANHSALREVSLKNAITVEEALTAPSHQSLALRLSGDIWLKELELSDETRIERDLERQSIHELFRISDAIKDKARSQARAAEVLDYLKQQLDMLNISWEVAPK